MLPCPTGPPEKPIGGWFWYDLENSKYKCPNGYMFENGNYPYWYSNCTVAKVWDPPAVESCKRKESSCLLVFQWENNNVYSARTCDYAPPLEYNLMDVIWPRKDTKLGSKITYSCPFRTGTTTKQLKGKH